MGFFTKFFSPAGDLPQDRPLPGEVANSAGGFAWAVDDWARLDRFLVLGSEGGTYYVAERALTLENAERSSGASPPTACVRSRGSSRCRRQAARRRTIRRSSRSRWRRSSATSRRARRRSRRCRGSCRTGTHLMHFAEYVQRLRRLGPRHARGDRRLVQRQARRRRSRIQLVKYQARDGWSTATCCASRTRARRRRRTTGCSRGSGRRAAGGRVATIRQLALVAAFEAREARATTVAESSTLVRGARAAARVRADRVADASRPSGRRCSTTCRSTAMIRNLATMTRVGLLHAELGRRPRAIVARLGDATRIAKRARCTRSRCCRRSMTYQRGAACAATARGRRSRRSSTRSTRAFYASVRRVEPTGKRTLLALDVSGSMASGAVAGVPGLTPRVASAAMALVTADRAETAVTRAWRFAERGRRARHLSPRQRLDDVLGRSSGLPFGGTDCALPMLWAREHRARRSTLRDLHRQRDVGRHDAPVAGAARATATRRASRPSWSWSA